MKQITILINEENENMIAKLLEYKNAEKKELLGPNAVQWAEEELAAVIFMLGVKERLTWYE